MERRAQVPADEKPSPGTEMATPEDPERVLAALDDNPNLRRHLEKAQEYIRTERWKKAEHQLEHLLLEHNVRDPDLLAEIYRLLKKVR